MTGQQLRNSILREAIQGRLVPNMLEPGEKTGAELLQLILGARQRTENEEKGKKAKKLTQSTIEEEPWDLPDGWCWARLGDIVDHRSGLWEGKKPPFIRVGVIRNANFTKKFTLSFDNIAYLNVEEKQFLSRRLEFGDIIIEKSGGGENQPVGRPVLFLKTDEDFSFSNFTQMIRIADKEIVLPSFLQQVLVAFYVSGVTVKLQSNTTNLRNLDFKGYLDLFVPLPPLSIQKSIVAKIEELLPLVDEYDKAAGELETLNKILPDKLRKSVLQEAIHGTLVPNDIPEGEATGSELLQMILKERQEKENKEKGKKAKKLTLSTIEEEPWDLPEGWCWCSVGDVCDIINGFTPLKSNPDFWNNPTIPWFTVEDIREQGRIITKTRQAINAKALAKDTSRILPANTVLLCCTASLGEYALTQIDLTTNQQFNGLVIPYSLRTTIFPKYLFAIMPHFKDVLNSICGKTTFGFVSVAKVSKMLLPIPPLSIQKAIVAKIEEIFSSINKLESIHSRILTAL